MTSAEREVDGLSAVRSDSRFLAFIAHFNGDRDYYECHEVMEELWLEQGRSPLLQGLLQAAVGLHHWDNGNYSGAVKLMSASLAKLSRYGDYALGLDLLKVRSDLKIALDILSKRPDDAPLHAFMLNISDGSLANAVKAWEKLNGASD
ncbi:DUF309 domain-containing protein [Cohnella sp.]|uniref:DUF309 domain-containing protein n=1 Tax=Cohnella sp. TaxID=1883426 RepID=UPI003565D889